MEEAIVVVWRGLTASNLSSASKIKLYHWIAKESKNFLQEQWRITSGWRGNDAILKLFYCVSRFAISITFDSGKKIKKSVDCI